MKKVVIFASGSGSNAENIILYFKNNIQITVAAVFSNNLNATVLDKANRLEVPTEVFNKIELCDGTVLNKINNIKPDLIVLAGFLLKFPENIIEAFPNKIINIHPALLPKYGGKGMYGMHVHRAVLENKDAETGITIHYVNKNYDEGEFIFQKNTSIINCKTPEEVAQKIHELEMECFPKVISEILNLKSKV